MLSLSVAVVDSRAGDFRDSESVAQSLQVAKRRAKAVEGNCLWYDAPDGGRNLLADPQILAISAPALPVDDSDQDIGVATYPPLGVSAA
jgi:hypothetical protein